LYNKWFHISAANLEDGIVVTFSDINDRKNSEEILRENNLKFEAIFNQSLQFMALLDLEGKYMDVNQTILNLTGRSKEDFLNNDFGFSSSWSLPGEKEKIISAIQKAAKGESIRQQVRIISLEKDIKIIDISIKPFSYKKGEINFIMLEGRDITEIVKANEEIKGKNKLIEGLLENFPIILMKINKKTEISYMSGSGLKVLGYNENEFKGTKYFSSGGR
jgi:PAS domain S-box-containing protein